MDGVGLPSDLYRLAVLPPYSPHWSEFSTEEQEKLVSNFLAVYLHNAINTKDFPRDRELEGLLAQLESTVKSLRHNAWCQLLERYGDRGEIPDRSAFLQLPHDEQVLLSIDRNAWELSVSPILEKLISWVCKNNHEIQTWHIARLQHFN